MDSNDDEFFDDIMEFYADEVIELGFRKPWTGACLGRLFLLRYGSEVVNDPDRAMVIALAYLSQVMTMSQKGFSPSIKSEETSARLWKAGLVNILFGCIRDPEAFENCKRNNGELKMIYDGFREFVKYLYTVIGRGKIERNCGDPILGRLFSTVDRAAAFTPMPGSTKLSHHVWLDELHHLAWETRNGKQTWGRMPHTIQILEYLRWEIRGRKDATCAVKKPWVATPLGKPSQSPPDDLSRLLPGNPSAPCAYCSASDASLQCHSCQPTGNDQLLSLTVYCNEACLRAHSAEHAAICKEIRDLSRSARLFQVAFEEFLRFTRLKTPFTVSKEDGVVRKWYARTAAQSDSEARQILSHLDFGREEEKAALYSLCCTTTQHSAAELLEFFIRREQYT